MITVDSRRRDTKSEETVKYYDGQNGRPVQYKPVRKINPDLTKLSPLATFIATRADGKYIGGMLLNGFLVRVEGAPGSMFEIELKKLGQEQADKMAKIWCWNKTDRATIRGWQFPVFEPEMDETRFFNEQAEKIAAVAGNGGRVVINNETMEVVCD